MTTEPALPATLCEAALRVLTESDADAKADLTHDFVGAWRSGAISEIGHSALPDHPARPLRPELKRPRDMPRRSTGAETGRRALVHAIAHIESGAIDLAWDVLARFVGSNEMPRAFYDDWVEVAADEARHFQMLAQRLGELGAEYGDLAAHDGLWEMAADTTDDLLARLALVPMVLEARGLDTAPGAAERLRQNGDEKTAAIMDQIANEEIDHVAAGVRWFEHGCKTRGLEPVAHFRALIGQRFKGRLKPPFDHDRRTRAGMGKAYYDPPP